MIAVGILGLDTSHAEGFADVLGTRDDATVHGVWDGGDVRSDAEVREFCAAYDAALYDDRAALRDVIDAAMVLTVDWETHAPFAVESLSEGIPTLVDKPIAGSTAELSKLETAANGTGVFGGSAVPYHDDFAAVPRAGSDRSLFAAGYNDYFYYRVHLVDVVRHLADADWERVEPRPGAGTTVEIRFADGTVGVLRFDGPPDAKTFSALHVGETTEIVALESTPAALANMYETFVDEFLSVVEGEADATDRVLDAASLALAVEAAVDGDCAVGPDSEELHAVAVPSDEFVAEYSPYY